MASPLLAVPSAPATIPGLGTLPTVSPRPQQPTPPVVITLPPRSSPNVAVGSAVSPLASALSAPAVTPESRAFERIPVPIARDAQVRSSATNNGSWLSAWHIMDEAKDHIDASYFIFNRDVFGKAFLGQLLRKQREGVKVRLLLDATGDTFGQAGFTMKTRGQDYLQELVAAGAEISIYNPFHIKLPKQLMDLSSAEAISANHDKIVSTERYAMTGGRNVAAEYFAEPEDHEGTFRDGDVVIDDPQAAAGLSAAVAIEMNRKDMTDAIKVDAFGNWSKRDAELLGTAAMMDAWIARTPFTTAEKTRLRGSERERNALADGLIDGAIAYTRAHGQPIPSRRELEGPARELVTNLELAGKNRGFDLNAGMTRGDVKVIDRTSVGTGAFGKDEIAPGLGMVVDAAQHHILITNPYVALSEAVRKKLEAAGKRGVRIDLLTNSPATLTGAVSQAFFMNEWPRLLARIPNLHIYVFAGERELHAKTGIADGEIASIGSFNLDLISSDINGEVIALTHSPALAGQLDADYRSDMANPANGIVEYTIERNADGTPLLRDGEPVIKYGPANHSSAFNLRAAQFIGNAAEYLTKRLPQLSPLTESQ